MIKHIVCPAENGHKFLPLQYFPFFFKYNCNKLHVLLYIHSGFQGSWRLSYVRDEVHPEEVASLSQGKSLIYTSESKT